MYNIIDEQLIRKYLGWCFSKCLNQSEIARIAGRKRAWASLLIRGKIKGLTSSTRARLKQVIGEES